jgi:ectoine hydroxylase-related dioxygenase (phytanoyl-CoA dioxygenase family)
MQLNAEQIRRYHEDGFLVVRNLFDGEEIDLLRRTAKEDKVLDDHSFGKADGEGGTIRLSLWNHPGDGLYGHFARCHRIVDNVELLLGDEAYHYHSKMVLKDPKVGGAWAWHQDYGYWYGNGLLFPDLASVMIAVDRATKENGCLQVIRKSHQMGRIDHVLTGDQAGADPERVAACLQVLELVHVELEPGDAVFFHANTLHRSDQNRSDHPRWAMICCYNSRHNNPTKTHHHPSYTPLIKVSDASLKQVGMKRFAEQDAVAWLDPAHERSYDTKR